MSPASPVDVRGENPVSDAPTGANRVSARPAGRDLLLAVLVGLAGLAASLGASRLVAARIIDPALDSVWFESDTWRKFTNMTCRGSDQDRASVHPLFGLATVPCTEFISRVTGFSPLKSARTLVALAAGASAGVLCAILRRLGRTPLESLLFALLLPVSATGVFWFGVPETYPFGALSVLLVVLALVSVPAGQAGTLSMAASAVLAGGVTVTNELIAALAVATAYPWRRALALVATSLAALLALMVIQRQMIHSAPILPLEHASRELVYMTAPTPTRVIQTVRALTLHSMLMPEIGARPARDPCDPPRRSVQAAPLRLAPVSLAALACWILLLGAGVAAVVRGSVSRGVGGTLFAAVLSQLALHAVYGEEAFLYSAHVLPMLVILAAMGAATRWRPLVLGAAALLVLLAPLVNVPAFMQCVAALPNP